MMGESEEKPHAILVAYPLQGHLIPSVHLAMKLASKGFTITFINTHSVHHQITRAQDSDSDPFTAVRGSGLDIRYMTVSDGLPVDFDRSLNHDQFMASLLHVFSAHVEEAVKMIVKSGRIHVLIADTFFVWPSALAKKYGLLHVSFWTETALVFSLYYHLDLLRINGHFDCPNAREDTIDYIPGVPPINPRDTMSYLQEKDATSVCHQIIFKAFQDAKGADFVLCNSIQELEPSTIAALHAKKPFYAVGPIFPSGFIRSAVATSLWPESDCTSWLDAKPRGSVLYVSFGSYAHLSKRDLTEISNGLSLSGVSFVWVLRPDIVSSDEVDPLPVGFREEVADRALIISWCSQNAVLKHPAIGGFLTHCGWNSTLESIWCKVPLLCFPLYTDQFTNQKLVVDDWKIGMRIGELKAVTRSEVSEKIKAMMSGKSGEECWKKVVEMSQILENAISRYGTSERNMDQFIKELDAKIHKTPGVHTGSHKSAAANP
ncbi:UDP-glucuronosyl/UDP-glucosyltransferase [Dillenia turbinata]|uniref:Glycosyltransferase n=1 Tax=Dillenia turbinata TaxID=194707 RepID=A0AAN8ZD14_9MAGN